MPSLTTPGKPMVTCSNLPCGVTSLTSSGTICLGFLCLGVLMRTRSTRKRPAAPTIAALRPVPPISMQRMRLAAATARFLLFLRRHHQVDGAVDQGHMAEGLGKIAQHALGIGIIF